MTGATELSLDWVHVPGGTYTPGEPEEGRAPVTVEALEVMRCPVTRGEYYDFCRFKERTMPAAPGSWEVSDDLPITHVSYGDAEAFASWVGGRLPTADESEYFSRGTDRRIYPWGNEEPYAGRLVWRDTQPWPVGARPTGASPFGLLDCAGNIWEWCVGCLVRGGSWGHADSAYFRCAVRNGVGTGYVGSTIGFRVVRRAPRLEVPTGGLCQPAGAAWANLAVGSEAREQPFRCPGGDGWGTRPERSAGNSAEDLRRVTCPSCVNGIVWSKP